MRSEDEEESGKKMLGMMGFCVPSYTAYTREKCDVCP